MKNVELSMLSPESRSGPIYLGQSIKDKDLTLTLLTLAHSPLIGPNDMLIAATARAYDTILVTHNTYEFGRITGLRLEDWGK
jgi:predicted nucleic acid-binding protein